MHIHSLDARELAAHAHALQQLARRLLRDAHAAEDAAQEAWVAALERPPRARESLTGWLAAVAANVGRNARRGARRRSDREHAVVRTEAEVPDVHALERAETARLSPSWWPRCPPSNAPCSSCATSRTGRPPRSRTASACP
jgi:DNA-directed RNA polymerase specialized sigma24 family protein